MPRFFFEPLTFMTVVIGLQALSRLLYGDYRLWETAYRFMKFAGITALTSNRVIYYYIGFEIFMVYAYKTQPDYKSTAMAIIFIVSIWIYAVLKRWSDLVTRTADADIRARPKTY